MVKLECISEKLTVKKFFGGEKTELASGVTVGKLYSAFAVPISTSHLQGTSNR